MSVIGLPPALANDDGYGSEWEAVMHCEGQEWRDADRNLIPRDQGPTPAEIVEVWWTSNGGGDLGSEIYTELQLYAVVRFEDGRWGYVEAWNDYTGWGCQDGVEWNVADTAEQLRPLITDEGRAHLEWAK